MGDRLTGGEADRSLCVICGLHPQAPEYKPFCSRRCADVDLHRWLGGVYAIPATPDDEDDESEANG